MGRADTHLHTHFSGFSQLGSLMKFPESVLTPETQVDRMRSLGYDVMALTDHDETAGAFKGAKYAKRFDDIELIVGEEVTTADGEIIGLFLSEKVPPGLPVEETVDIIRSQGGLVIAPHPFSFHVPGIQEKMLELDVDGFETINGGHPDSYSNPFARKVMDAYPGRWADLAGSDAHSVYTSGTCWTEFEGTTAEDFRKSVLGRRTHAVGKAAPPFGQVQWSVEVVLGGQRLLLDKLKGRLELQEGDQLAAKIDSINRLKAGTGLVAGSAYLFPPITCLAATLSLIYLGIGARRMRSKEDDRLKGIGQIIRGVDSKKVGNGKKGVLQDRDVHTSVASRGADGRGRVLRVPPVPRIRQVLLLLACHRHLEAAGRLQALPGNAWRDRGRPGDARRVRRVRRGPGEGRRGGPQGPPLRGARHRRDPYDRLEEPRCFGR
ncbi:MAG: PHP domain-containing protein [Candidatus Methanomethylophilaceae archaeon]|nr:PHP domain-containing protein [Candidatus Methanomethylophilaceae archaeon]